MSGQDERVAYTGVTTESDDMFALDCTDSLDLQKPCDTTGAIVPGDNIQAPRLVRGVAIGSEESVRIVQAAKSGWVVARLGLPGAKVRRATSDGAEGWIVEQPLRKPLQWSKWFGSRRHGVDAETEAAQCKATWDLEDSKAFLVRGDSSTSDSSELLYSLDKARKCGELEAAGLLCGDSLEGRAEFVRRLSAANFNGRVQQCDGDGDDTIVMRVQKHGSSCPSTTMTSLSAVTSPPSPVPSIAAYNIRFLSLSDSSEQRAQHQRKLANVRHLVQQFFMSAILETHVTGGKAELLFCRYVEGTRRFFIHCMAVLVQEAWADHFNPTLVTAVDGVIIAFVWECGASRHFAFSFRLDAHAEAPRIHQLQQATRWAKENVRTEDVVVFAGDRKFCSLRFGKVEWCVVSVAAILAHECGMGRMALLHGQRF